MILISVKVSEWPPFGKKLLTCLTVCSGCNLSIWNFSYFQFRLEGGIFGLILPVPGHCLHFTFGIQNEPRYEKTGILHMQKQRRRSAAQ